MPQPVSSPRRRSEVDLKDKRGRTALTFAAELGHPEVTEWLLKAGADVRGRTGLSRSGYMSSKAEGADQTGFHPSPN